MTDQYTCNSVGSVAMLVSVKITMQSGSVEDKELTDKTTTETGAAAGKIRVRKSILGDRLKDVNKAYRALRTYHYEMTTPWSKGEQMIANSIIPEYETEWNKLKSEAEQLKNAFLADYEQIVQDDQAALNGSFKLEDYPSRDDIDAKFSAEIVEFKPLADPAMFPPLTGKIFQRIRNDYEQRFNQQIEQTTTNIYERIYKYVGRIAERLNQPDATFRDSLINNVQRLVELIPHLNITSNPKVIELAQEMEGLLQAATPSNTLIDTTPDPQLLRDNPAKRADVGHRASAILGKMEGFLGN